MNFLAVAAALAAGATLYDQAVVRLLHERFENSRVSYLLLDAASGRVVDSNWSGADAPVPAGSLVKPFTALAYGRVHGFRFPEHICRGSSDGCWLPGGHGRVDIVRALANSCNAYFDALAAHVPFADMAAVAQRFSLAPPPEEAPPAAYVGRAGLWKLEPLEIARAYAALASNAEAEIVLQGLAECARSGTGRAVHEGLAKTGTAPCIHEPKAPGDGYVIAMDRGGAAPRVLLVRVHGVPGAVAATTAAEIMRIVHQGR